MDLRQYLDYNENFFEPKDFEDAKRIVLGYGNMESVHKWDVETEWTVSMFKRHKILNSDSVVLDWGVGVGRMSKAIIDTFGCTVVGVDINQSMLNHASEYVGSNKFTPMLVDEFVNSSITVTSAIAIWALQHSVNVLDNLQTIKEHLIYKGKLFVFEETKPCIPLNSQDVPWFLLHKSNFNYINSNFILVDHGKFPSYLEIPENNNAWWGVFENKK